MDKMFGDGIKKFVLMGIGAAAMTVEKSQQMVDELVKKGELTVEQGKELNQELKRNVRKTIDEAAEKKEAEEKKEATLEEKIIGRGSARSPQYSASTTSQGGSRRGNCARSSRN